MKARGFKALAILVALGVVLTVLAGTAQATHVDAEVAIPDELNVGSPTRLEVALHAAGAEEPIVGAEVVAYSNATFGDVSGDIVVARDVTDDAGVAVLDYEPRAAGNHELRLEYVAPGETEPETIATTVAVGGFSQLHQSTSGIQVPGLNVWLIIALISGVWLLLFSVGVRVFAIARAGTDAEVLGNPAAEARVGVQGTPQEAGSVGG